MNEAKKMTLKQIPIPIPTDLATAISLAYEPIGLICKNFEKEVESEEYGAFTFEMNEMRVKFRVSKITPTKIGQFVTLWKRVGDGVILPYDLDDSIDLFIVSARKGGNFGQFVFPKTVLFDKGIVSKEGKGGKRAIRIYPPWDIADSRQAKKTQAWQLTYFFEIPAASYIDISKVQKLFQKA